MSRGTLAGLLVFLYRQETVAFSEFLGEVIHFWSCLCDPRQFTIRLNAEFFPTLLVLSLLCLDKVYSRVELVT